MESENILLNEINVGEIGSMTERSRFSVELFDESEFLVLFNDDFSSFRNESKGSLINDNK
jgi:hypothetical protein